MARQVMRVNGVDLCVEAFGDAGDPVILLIGAGASMDWWDEEFCRRLTAGSRHVVRYDHRDTGESVASPPGAPTYTQDDLVEDAVGVLDACGLAVAHVVGISMGCDIAQRLARACCRCRTWATRSRRHTGVGPRRAGDPRAHRRRPTARRACRPGATSAALRRP